MSTSDLQRRITEHSTPSPDGCWRWDLYVTPDGYGRIWTPGRGSIQAHRAAYEAWRGPIPGDLTVDHICFTTTCVNPSHLRLLPIEENSKRQRSAAAERCVNGHDYTPENTYIRPARDRGGRRDCRTCIRERAQRYQQRKKAAA